MEPVMNEPMISIKAYGEFAELLHYPASVKREYEITFLDAIDDPGLAPFRQLLELDGEVGTFMLEGKEAQCRVTVASSPSLEAGTVAFRRVKLTEV